jgi:hypothetical protein
MLESALMAKISGKLMVDLFPDGTVRLAILPSVDQRNASPVTVEDLYAAEELFMMCGLSKDRAAALRAEVKRNKGASLETNVEGEAAVKFRHTMPSKWDRPARPVAPRLEVRQAAQVVVCRRRTISSMSQTCRSRRPTLGPSPTIPSASEASTA